MTSRDQRLRRLLGPLGLLAPLLFVVAVLLLSSRSTAPTKAASNAVSTSTGRLVLVIIDSLRRENLEPGGMPHLSRLAERGHLLDVATCSANFTLPCLRTMLEGRQSPFSVALQNYTGAEGSAASVPAAAAASGLGIALVSDHSLGSLYSRHALLSFNVDAEVEGIFERDRRGVEHMVEALEDPRIRLLVAHLTGTDKAAHTYHPGTPAYHEHFAAVDRALASVWPRLDLTRDALLVVGDHGHDETGNHTRRSVALLAGAHFDALAAAGALPGALDQTEIAYLVDYGLGLPPPADYEGRLLLTRALPESAPLLPVEREHANAFISAQREAYGVPPEGDVAAAFAAIGTARRIGAVAELERSSALLACYFAWLVLIGLRRERRAATITLGMGGLSVLLVWALPPALGPYVALGIVGGTVALTAGRYRRGRWAATLLVLLLGAALSAWCVKPWAELFHNHDGRPFESVAFYVLLAGAGAAVALVRGRGLAALPGAALAVACLIPPSGVYYYQFNQTLFWGFAIGGGVWLLWRIGVRLSRRRALLGPGADHRRRPIAMAAACVGVAIGLVAALAQEAGGWEYHLFAIEWLDAGGPAIQLGAFAGFVILTLVVLPPGKPRAVFAVVSALGAAYSAGLGGAPWSRLAAAHAMVLLVASICCLTAPAAPFAAAAGRLRDQTDGALLAVGAALVANALLHGFRLQSIDFAFAYAWFGGLGPEWAIASAAFVATTIKYGIPIGLLFVAVVAFRPVPLSRLSRWAIIALHVKLLALLTQIAVMKVATEEKLFELAISDFLLVSALMVMIAAGYGTALVIAAVTPAHMKFRV